MLSIALTRLHWLTKGGSEIALAIATEDLTVLCDLKYLIVFLSS